MNIQNSCKSTTLVLLHLVWVALLVSCDSNTLVTKQPILTEEWETPSTSASTPTVFEPEETQTNIPLESTTIPESVGEYSIVFERLEPAGVIVVDTVNHFYQALLIENKPAIKFLGWSKNKCRAIVQDSNYVVYEVGLNGETFKTINLQLEGSDKTLSNIDLSPDSTHMALMIGEGNLGLRRYEIQNIGITTLDTPNTIHYLTDNGDAYAISWSLAGDRLAYSTTDQNGIYQIFIVDENTYNV